MAGRIEYARAARKDVENLDPQVARRIREFLEQRLANLDDPRSIGKPLHGSRLGTFWRYRVGDWRIVASIEEDKVLVLVVRIGHRREVYG
ncbi:mRNA interferase RelE/StbE (plasmid) [Methylomarinovum tepidoasis]|uniref:mRNA interferase RelE/StbE n=1 Tax=Methylomarinovum tepidoasis TaxID=2840183 RepID=A0AAU9CU88_9GAMM|nr:type II toxin-antitoxin system RelE/ParE family toxin [Methylomarinovum sp. IN45]BCX90003.1 mRNA interferase RelE/StbE [Methylomarinovum sp. IN45]